MRKEVVYFTKDRNNKIRVYTETVGFNSEDELKGLLSNKVFASISKKKCARKKISTLICCRKYIRKKLSI